MLTDHLPGQHADGGGGDVLRLQLPVLPSHRRTWRTLRAHQEYPGALPIWRTTLPRCPGTKSTFATLLEYGASIIALVAIFKSFFGHYLGTLEGLNGLILRFGYKGG